MPAIPKDWTGVVMNNLTGVRPVYQNSRGRWHWEFKCYCGTMFTCAPLSVKNGSTQSCGCAGKPSLHRAHNNPLNKSTYHSWAAMKQRCNNETCADYFRYGGRGIKVCDSWMNFDFFLSDMGVKPDDSFTIERINNDGNYEPTNCKWATRKEQANNRRPENFTQMKALANED